MVYGAGQTLSMLLENDLNVALVETGLVLPKQDGSSVPGLEMLLPHFLHR